MIEDLVIKVLEPSLIPDWIDFFDNRAFEDNPDWKGCYCLYYHRRIVQSEAVYDGEGSVPLTSDGRRLAKRDRAAALISRGNMKGYLAYHGGKVVGWCNINRKSAYALLDSKDGQTAALACFIIQKEYRRQGVSRALLTAAIADAKQSGFAAVEAHPKFRAKSEAGNFHGHPELLASLGFAKVKTPGGSTIMRLVFT